MKQNRQRCPERKNGERGATLVLFSLMVALVGIPMVGLAIDGSILFWAKARLSAAVDASALAAGRSFNIKNTATQNTGTVVGVAQQWFWANFPNGWLGTSVVGGQPNVQYVTTSASTQQVTVTASAAVPMYFMRVAGFNSVTIAASAQSSRRNITAVLILDVSGSMAGNPCTQMKQVAANFVNSTFTENFDSVGLVTFSTTVWAQQNPSLIFKSTLTQDINSISCGGDTSTAQAVNAAYRLIQAANTPGSSNVIVLFTDGQPNGLVADFPIRRSQDQRYGADWSYNTLSTYPPSTCAASLGQGPLRGNIAEDYDTGTYGITFGLIDSTPFTGGNSLIQAPGCFFQQDISQVRFDVAYIPNQDIYGNRTDAGYGTNSPYFGPGVSSIARFPAGTPYANQIRPDLQDPGTTAASVNAADYQGQAIRGDLTYQPIIYTIGLGGNPGKPIDNMFLMRLANDTRSPIYTPNQAAGVFAYASDPSQLSAAFSQIASQILRLSK